ncbi:MAG: hypothetical protein ABIA76_01890 [Candidatus Diapherotrites archaeon]
MRGKEPIAAVKEPIIKKKPGLVELSNLPPLEQRRRMQELNRLHPGMIKELNKLDSQIEVTKEELQGWKPGGVWDHADYRVVNGKLDSLIKQREELFSRIKELLESL